MAIAIWAESSGLPIVPPSKSGRLFYEILDIRPQLDKNRERFA
jgi:hypothetical protein